VGRFQYTGHTWLSEVGAYYYKARFYSPTNGGRLYQTDPIDILGGINLYAYVGNDPVNWVDPLGLDDGPLISVTGPRRCEGGRMGGPGLGFICVGAIGTGPGQLPVAPRPVVSRNPPPSSGRRHLFDLVVVTQCPANRAFEAVRAAGNSAPGAPYAQANTHDIFLNDIFPWRENPITQTVDVGRRKITNVTAEGHRFHPGTVTITVNDLGGNYSSIHVVGTGSGATPSFNNFVGATFFGGMAHGVADYCAAASGHPNIKE
jgi:RHS repeat-associated protein